MVGVLICLQGISLQADLGASGLDSLVLGSLLRAVRRRAVRLAALLGGRLLMPAVDRRLGLRPGALVLDSLFALLGGHLILDVRTLDLRLYLLLVQLGLGFATAGLLPGLTGVELGLGLRLLKAPLTLEVLTPGGRTGGLLGFSDQSAQDAAGRSLWIAQLAPLAWSGSDP